MSANPPVSSQAILEKFAQVVAASLRIDAARVVESAYLDELGAESLDLLQITMEAETAFDILLPQKNILETAQEVYGAGVLVQEARVTQAGQSLLRRRLPEPLWSGLPADPTVADFNRLFLRVDTWVWMIAGLMEHTPRECKACGATIANAVAGRLKCRTCGDEYELIPGDEINRRWIEQYQIQQQPVSGTYNG